MQCSYFCDLFSISCSRKAIKESKYVPTNFCPLGRLGSSAHKTVWILLFKILPYSPSKQFPFGAVADALRCVASFQSRIHEEDTIIQVTCVQSIYILWYTASVTMTKEYNTHRDTLTRCYSEMCNATAYYTRPCSSLFFLSSP